MERTGAELLTYALEQIGVKYTFGVPGVHNIEIYDALASSDKIEPLLVIHENGGSFMADAVSRVSDTIGTVILVPAAGITNASSGIGEAFLDGIPMLVIASAVRNDTGKEFQLHQLDQVKLIQGIVKKTFSIKTHKDVVPMIYEAYNTAISGEPGPVFVEIPANIQMLKGKINELPKYSPKQTNTKLPENVMNQIVNVLINSEQVGIYVGWGAKDLEKELIEIAELLGSPVSTTLQGKSVFPENHPLHTGVGFGASAVPAAQKAFKKCDTILAIAVRFAEVATGSYSLPQPKKLIHIDVNPNVFNKNYKADITLQADAKVFVPELLKRLKEKLKSPKNSEQLKSLIKKEKEKYLQEWLNYDSKNKVNPAKFFVKLREVMSEDDFIITDDGIHTFLTMELFPVYKSRRFLSPTDFNCMGYCVPATIGVKLMYPKNNVVGIVGDGAFLMTALELATATKYNIAPTIFIFNDGELGQIAQFQKNSLNRKTATILPKIDYKKLVESTGASYLKLENNSQIDEIINKALKPDNKAPVVVDVNIDYSKKTQFSKGVVKTNFLRLPLKEKLRFASRLIGRKVFGT